jgi:hypothetical protein
MAKGEWSTHKARQLAQDYRVSLDTVGSWAGEASRVIRRVAAEDREALLVAIVAGVERIATTALVRGDSVERESDRVRYLELALKALEARARVLGIVQAEGVTVTVLQGMSEEKLRERFRELAGRDWEPPPPLLPPVEVPPDGGDGEP